MNRDKSNTVAVPVIGVSRHRLLTDGHGVTTLVAFHGCPLKCKYCLNPQCHDDADKFARYNPESLYEALRVDDLYFRATGGGVTFGGGEALMQADFICRFRELCGNDWKITIETSLHGTQEEVDKLAPIVDEWIIDIKTSNLETYMSYTGKSMISDMLLKHLTGVRRVQKDKIVLRIPIIPGYVTPEEAEETRRYYELRGFTRFDIFTYQTEPRHKEGSLINGLEPGKARCEVLKSIRREIARNNGIDLPERKCSHEGNCPGTCPLCEYEVKRLNYELQKLESSDVKVNDELVKCIEELRNQCADDTILGNMLTHEETLMQDAPDTLDGDIGDISPNADPDTLEGEAIPHPGYIPPDNDATELGGKISFFQEKFKRVFFKECAVAGVSFHLKYNDELWDELETGVELALVRERKNKYDRNAVAVALADDFDGDHDNFDFDFILGYIPRECNTEIAAMMDAGYDDKFEAEISTFKRHGNLNDRIRITIWLLSKEPEVVRPDLLRIQYLNHTEMRGMLDELQDRGTVHFRWGGFPPWERNLPEVGDEVVFMNHHFSSVLMYHMRVLAIGDDARPYLEDPTETEWVDDCAPYVLTNIAGPIRIRFENSLNFLKSKRLEDRVVYDWLEPDESDSLKVFIKMKSELWLSRNNVDADPSIDDPIEY